MSVEVHFRIQASKLLAFWLVWGSNQGFARRETRVRHRVFVQISKRSRSAQESFLRRIGFSAVSSKLTISLLQEQNPSHQSCQTAMVHASNETAPTSCHAPCATCISSEIAYFQTIPKAHERVWKRCISSKRIDFNCIHDSSLILFGNHMTLIVFELE